ncbi:hypothetical protein C8R43DRAFT_962666 [Mycena crocata]|nr:hypothetical protein C8R43DRAFT_962666 [Mycena crocata]
MDPNLPNTTSPSSDTADAEQHVQDPLPAYTTRPTTPVSDNGYHSDDTDDSLPDLVRVTDSEIRAITSSGGPRTVNGITNSLQSMQISGNHPANGTSTLWQTPQTNGNRTRRGSITSNERYHPSFNNHIQLNGIPTGDNWQASAHLAHLAIRDAVADRLNIIVNGPATNNTRRGRGGAPYRGRGVNGHMIYDLIQRLQRWERAIQGLNDESDHDWVPGRF